MGGVIEAGAQRGEALVAHQHQEAVLGKILRGSRVKADRPVLDGIEPVGRQRLARGDEHGVARAEVACSEADDDREGLAQPRGDRADVLAATAVDDVDEHQRRDARGVGERLGGDEVRGHARAREGVEDDRVGGVVGEGRDVAAAVAGADLQPGLAAQAEVLARELDDIARGMTDMIASFTQSLRAA